MDPDPTGSWSGLDPDSIGIDEIWIQEGHKDPIKKHEAKSGFEELDVFWMAAGAPCNYGVTFCHYILVLKFLSLDPIHNAARNTGSMSVWFSHTQRRGPG